MYCRVISYCTLCCISLSFYSLCLQKRKHRNLPQALSPDKSVLKMAVAQCNYEPKGTSAFRLVRSDKYYILQEGDSDWWKVRDLEG